MKYSAESFRLLHINSSRSVICPGLKTVKDTKCRRWSQLEWLLSSSLLLFSPFFLLFLFCPPPPLPSPPQSSASDSRRVGSGPAAPAAVPPGSAQQVAADPPVLCHTARPGVCVCVCGNVTIPEFWQYIPAPGKLHNFQHLIRWHSKQQKSCSVHTPLFTNCININKWTQTLSQIFKHIAYVRIGTQSPGDQHWPIYCTFSQYSVKSSDKCSWEVSRALSCELILLPQSDQQVKKAQSNNFMIRTVKRKVSKS